MKNVTILNEKIKEVLLNDEDILKNTVQELNSWNSCLDNLEYWENDEEFFNTFFEGKPMEVARATYYGDYRFMDEYVKFNAYGNLESTSDIITEMQSCIDDIIENIISCKDDITLDDELEELFEESEEENEEE